MSNAKMQIINPYDLLHLPSRVAYLQSFTTFNPSIDGPLIASTKPILAPLLPTILDAVYTHLLTYSITAKSFAPAQQRGQPAVVDIQSLHLDHENIKHRKNFLKAYLVKIVSNEDWAPDSKIWDYLDRVGKMHTGSQSNPGFAHRAKKPPLRVEYAHMALLLGWVSDAVTGIVMGIEDMETESKVAVVRAFGKFWWIQNDLFARHYVEDWETGENVRGDVVEKKTAVGQAMVGGLLGLATGIVLAMKFLA